MANELELLDRLLSSSEGVETAWKEFLQKYSNLFLKTIWEFEKDRDDVMDKYVYVCSKFAERDFAVLRKFRKEYGKNPPTFATWLRAILRNMCVDAYRSAHGRRRYPKALMAMSADDRSIFAMHYWRGLSVEEIQQELQVRKNGSTQDVYDVLKKIENSLLRLPEEPLGGGARFVPYAEHLAAIDEEDVPEVDVDALERWLSKLESRDRLILRLRFWEDIPALEIARVLKISPEGQIYSILRKSLVDLRKHAQKSTN